MTSGGKSLERRLRRLEERDQVALPWHRPARDWTDGQLLVVIGEGVDVSDERLLAIAGDAAAGLVGP